MPANHSAGRTIGTKGKVPIGPQSASGRRTYSYERKRHADSPAFVPLTPTELDAKLGPHIEVTELIGHGGMGAVYKARQTRLNRFVAIKVLRPWRKGMVGIFMSAFKWKRGMAELDHPGIVTIHDFGETEDSMLYFLMEYVDGEDLHRLIQDGQLPLNTFSVGFLSWRMLWSTRARRASCTGT